VCVRVCEGVLEVDKGRGRGKILVKTESRKDVLDACVCVACYVFEQIFMGICAGSACGLPAGQPVRSKGVGMGHMATLCHFRARPQAQLSGGISQHLGAEDQTGTIHTLTWMQPSFPGTDIEQTCRSEAKHACTTHTYEHVRVRTSTRGCVRHEAARRAPDKSSGAPDKVQKGLHASFEGDARGQQHEALVPTDLNGAIKQQSHRAQKASHTDKC